MVKIKCRSCLVIGIKVYPFGKNAKPRRSLTHKKGCKNENYNINTIRKKVRE